MFRYLKNIWVTTSLGRKLGIYAAVVVLVIGLSAAFNISLMDYALDSFHTILKDNAKCLNVQSAIEAESIAFESYARDRSQDCRAAYEEACAYTSRCISLLPFSYRVVGPERYARTWSLKNAYEGYTKLRKTVLAQDTDDPDYVTNLYRVYSMQNYLQTYARRLLQVTMQEGSQAYQDKLDFYQNAPCLILLFSAALVILALFITRVVSHSWLDPLRKLVKSTKKIAVNDFSGEDVVVENRDEMGELVQAFNKMKHATKGYIDTLMSNYEMSKLLHKEELERVETERRLADVRTDLLKSQINPHFLFNTLNTISCMAKLEDAATTDRMITSMSSLFRYNLKTTEQVVPLSRELGVVEDYIYIQRMRFRDRIRYRSDIRVDVDKTEVPSFLLQPLAENSYIHGLSKKEAGGVIVIRCWREGEKLLLSVADTGLGIEERKKKELERALRGGRTSESNVGIGLGNIYERLQLLYPGSSLELYSRVGHGTVVRIEILQEGETDGSADHSR